ncbi:FixH family protein [Parvibaculum sp.]|uniref:FixH family protein n=1 Tax=Parvibaculum sp. TaxID=2024848 RepID=UPI003297ACA8
MSVENSDFRPSTRFGKVTGWHVLSGFVLFFAIVFGVNGLMVYRALSTFDGVEVEGAYQKGRTYNHLLERMDAQRQLGWSSGIKTTALPGEGRRTALRVTFTGTQGEPVNGLAVRGTFWRPVVSGEDKSMMLVQTAPGIYEAEFPLAHSGNWLVRIAAEGLNGETFVEEKRVIIRD